MFFTPTSFIDNGPIPAKFGCQADNISPGFKLGGVPAATQSLALTAIDFDSRPHPWVHWLAWNLPADLSSLTEGHLPDGHLEGMNDFGYLGYGGPCPKHGLHHYRFQLLALDCQLSLPAGASLTELEQAMAGHILASADCTGLYKIND